MQSENMQIRYHYISTHSKHRKMQIKTFTIVFAYVRVFAPHFALASHLNEIIFEKKSAYGYVGDTNWEIHKEM